MFGTLLGETSYSDPVQVKGKAKGKGKSYLAPLAPAASVPKWAPPGAQWGPGGKGKGKGMGGGKGMAPLGAPALPTPATHPILTSLKARYQTVQVPALCFWALTV